MPKLPPSQPQATDTEALLSTLRLLTGDPRLSQRQLAALLGISLGKTNYLLQALLGKGLLKVRNFRRSDNKLGYAYLLTPKGAAEKIRLTRAFLSRKELEFDMLKKTIAELRNEIRGEADGDDRIAGGPGTLQ